MPVYFIREDENGCTSVNIGVAKSIEAHKCKLQTGKLLELRLLGWLASDDDFELERQLYRRFGSGRTHSKWFQNKPDDLLPLLTCTRAGQRGFVSNNANASHITGYDSDAVLDYPRLSGRLGTGGPRNQ